MAIALRPKLLTRYRDLARLLLKHGRSDLVARVGLEETLQDEDRRETDAPEEDAAAELADDLENMGPTYIKLGQLLSTRVDLLPPPYIKALSRLQDRVEPV